MRHAHDSLVDIVGLLSRVVRSSPDIQLVGDENSLTGRIEAVHLGPPHLTVVCYESAESVERALQSKTVQLRARTGAARLEFTVAGNDVYSLGCDGEIVVPMPKQLIRFDRRAHYRGSLPSGLYVTCAVPIRGVALAAQRAHDISLGGIGLTFGPGLPAFKTGDVMRECTIHLPGFDPFTIDLEIRCLADVSAEGGVRLGCRFLGGSPAFESAVRAILAQCD